jgi:hypothetical protein
METSANPYLPAIEALEVDMADLERQWNALFSAVNVLRGKAGLPPREPNGGLNPTAADQTPSASGGNKQIRPDAFHRKTMGAAAREYLELRGSPATPRQIYEALNAGGYEFRSKDVTNAMVILRALLRKSSQMFERLPNNGTYGLKKWYPASARAAKPSQPVGAAPSGNRAEDKEPKSPVAESETADTKEVSAA